VQRGSERDDKNSGQRKCESCFQETSFPNFVILSEAKNPAGFTSCFLGAVGPIGFFASLRMTGFDHARSNPAPSCRSTTRNRLRLDAHPLQHRDEEIRQRIIAVANIEREVLAVAEARRRRESSAC